MKKKVFLVGSAICILIASMAASPMKTDKLVNRLSNDKIFTETMQLLLTLKVKMQPLHNTAEFLNLKNKTATKEDVTNFAIAAGFTNASQLENTVTAIASNFIKLRKQYARIFVDETLVSEAIIHRKRNVTISLYNDNCFDKYLALMTICFGILAPEGATADETLLELFSLCEADAAAYWALCVGA